MLNKEQKSSILLLLASKAFERLAFYTIMAILVKYLMDSLDIETNKAAIFYSVFYGAVGLTTIFSGLLGDLRDRMKIVKTGFILLTVMYLVIAFLPGISVIVVFALILLGVGVGLTSPNIIVFLGNIYNEKGKEIAGLSGFILFSIAVNIGALIAPLISITLKDNLGYYSVFLFAFISGLTSLILFLKFKENYNKLDLVAEQKNYISPKSEKGLNSLIVISVLLIGILIRLALNQRGISFNNAIGDLIGDGFNLNEKTKNIEVLISIVLFVMFAFVVTRVRNLNWGKVFNMILIGLTFSIIGFLLVGSYEFLSKIMSGKSILLQSFIFVIIAETLITPTITYLIYRSSPIKRKGLYQGIAYIAFAISNQLLFIGLLLYDKIGTTTFIIFSGILLISALLVFILKRKVNHKLTEIE
jgi:MFS family permease